MTKHPWYWQRQRLFDQCSPAARQSLLDIGEVQVVHARQMIFRADDPPQRVYLVLQGLIQVYSLTPQGDLVTLWFCGEEEVFGSGGIAGVGPQSVFAQAVGAAQILSMNREDFERVITEQPQLALNTIRLVSGRLRLAVDALVENIAQPPQQRLARLLLRLACQCAQRTAQGLVFELRFTHQELAQMIGSSRQTVNSQLREFSQQGLIQVVDRRLVLLDADALAEQFAG